MREPSSRGWMYYLWPPLFGAAALVVIVGLRMLANLSSITRNPAMRAQVPRVLGAVAGAGCAAGVAYVVLGRPARRLPVVGPYVTGVITIAAYMGAFVVVAPFISSEPLIESRSDVIIYAVITVFFGLLAGHSWFRDKGAAPDIDVKRTGA